MGGMMPEDDGRRKVLSIPMTEWENGTLGAPEVPGALLSARLTTSVDLDAGRTTGLVAIEGNRAGLRWLAYELLAIAHAPDSLAGARLHVHAIDDDTAQKRNGVAVTIHWNEALCLPE